MNLRLQPPAMLPLSLTSSSRTYSDHVPFGFKPLKTDKAVPYGPTGAGLGKVSPATKSRSEESRVGKEGRSESWADDAKKKVSVTLFIFTERTVFYITIKF